VGWFGGASIGAKLGLMHMGKQKFVTAIVGDGTFLFGVPASFYWMSRRYSLPFLTIVLNNSGWNAPRRSALLVHPAGYTAAATNEEMNISLDPSPDYVYTILFFYLITFLLNFEVSLSVNIFFKNNS
jgi:thiamine pyrophosphate-dependent acetolactate synthase large subunit-like protein